jgi:hypothetical protein
MLPSFCFSVYYLSDPDNNGTKSIMPGGIDDLTGKVPGKLSL